MPNEISKVRIAFDHKPELYLHGKATAFDRAAINIGEDRRVAVADLGNGVYARLKQRADNRYDVILYSENPRALADLKVHIEGGAVSRVKSRSGDQPATSYESLRNEILKSRTLQFNEDFFTAFMAHARAKHSVRIEAPAPTRNQNPQTERAQADPSHPRYLYCDQDMTALGRVYETRIAAERKEVPRTLMLAPVSNLEGDTLRKNLSDVLQRHLSTLSQNRPLQIAVPYNLGNTHWTGILVKLDPASKENPVNVEYMDSLGSHTEIPRHASDAITTALSEFKFMNPRFVNVVPPYVQNDITSCGPCTMANLLQRSSGLDELMSNARQDMQALRQKQLRHIAPNQFD